MYKSLLALSLILPTTVSAEQLWLTVDKDTLPAIAELQGFAVVPNIQVAASSSPAAVVRVDSSQQDILTAVMHDTYHAARAIWSTNRKKKPSKRL
ncbi:hypothetical protein CS022_09880 [Veronia nyctiphanis]|uniref:Uncharacterized protein n=1 Tax=Veronia nyctiphanis TaxID=1278244 RepID=A0A4V1LSY3_9GAMM|nr:hypothetical protein [Veronia nyctiphanis]RXJ73298.1 hypothetical protein CS022_09880 [Veronia nyctiphanis]